MPQTAALTPSIEPPISSSIPISDMHILALPVEILDIILDMTDYKDLKRLSATSKPLRQLLLGRLFARVECKVSRELCFQGATPSYYRSWMHMLFQRLSLEPRFTTKLRFYSSPRVAPFIKAFVISERSYGDLNEEEARLILNEILRTLLALPNLHTLDMRKIGINSLIKNYYYPSKFIVFESSSPRALPSVDLSSLKLKHFYFRRPNIPLLNCKLLESLEVAEFGLEQIPFNLQPFTRLRSLHFSQLSSSFQNLFQDLAARNVFPVLESISFEKINYTIPELDLWPNTRHSLPALRHYRGRCSLVPLFIHLSADLDTLALWEQDHIGPVSLQMLGQYDGIRKLTVELNSSLHNFAAFSAFKSLETLTLIVEEYIEVLFH